MNLVKTVLRMFVKYLTELLLVILIATICLLLRYFLYGGLFSILD